MAKPARGQIFTGTSGNDALVGTSGNDQLYGYGGDDSLHGGAGNDTIQGHEANDSLFGGDGDDQLYGQEGNDAADGGAGNDLLGAGPGNDILTGGTGADRFFVASNFEGGTNVHTITDFSRAEGDLIDLRGIDADGDTSNNPRKGNTDFMVVDGPSAVPGAAWLEAIIDPATGQQTGVAIYLNTDADADHDTRIDVLGVSSLTWGVDIFG